MKKGHLSEFFIGAAAKILSPVEAMPNRSNQHEIGTTAAMRSFLGEQRASFQTIYIWSGGEQDSIIESGNSTLYDSRERQPLRRPEWRIYYDGNAVTNAMMAGDTLFIARRPDSTLLFVVVPTECALQNKLLWLFGFDQQLTANFEVVSPNDRGDAELDFAARLILDEIGIEFEDPQADKLDDIVRKFGTTFPKTFEFSQLARLTLPEVDARDDPDAALVAWLEHEEAMFRRLERAVVQQRLSMGFHFGDTVDIDGFLSFSLSVQNRRKSRMGHAFEHQLTAVFDALNIPHTRQAKTEQGNTVDFVFPGVEEYRDPNFPADRLTMLAAKASCKERWRQVLPEADRISVKHLVTLEPGITIQQTDQMRAARLQLIVPLAIHPSYADSQREWLWSLGQFVRQLTPN